MPKVYGQSPQLKAQSHRTEIDFNAPLRHPARMAKPALGRGLGALLSGSPAITTPTAAAAAIPAAVPDPLPDLREHVQRVPLDKIRPSAMQPRKSFSDDALKELADSIREQGVVQPLIVRERGGYFELIAGERRWRASQLLNLPEVPVIVREADDRTVLELALIENLQRENLNAIEEALGYSQLAEQFQLTQEEIAIKVGKSRTAVANATRLLKLPVSVQGFIREGRLSVGHAKVILGLAGEKDQSHAAERIIKEGLNVRQTEGLVAKLQARGTKISSDIARTPAIVPVDSNIGRLEEKMREKFGTKVHLKYAHGKGAVEISFFSDEELQRVLEILGINAD
jgi:ParB family chromosome partitioning protein